MSENKEIENLAGYQRTAEKMTAFTSAVKQPDSSQLTEEHMRALLDACDHSKNSYAEEMTLEALNGFIKQYEVDKVEQAKENEENRELALKSYKVSIAAAIFGGASFFVALITLIVQSLG